MAQPPSVSVVGSGGHYGQAITVGADGAMWLLGPRAGGRVPDLERVPTTAGRSRTYRIPGRPDVVVGLVAAQDGELWYAGNYLSFPGAAAILSTTTAGRTKRFPITVAGGDAAVGGLVAGPQDTLWYTGDSSRGSFLIKMSLGGGAHRVLLSGDLSTFDAPLTFGPGGAFWISSGYRVTTTGKARRVRGSGDAIVPGADGNLWLGAFPTAGIDRLSATGNKVVHFSFPASPFTSPNDGATALAPGPDGNIWFVKSQQTRGATVADSAGEIDPQGHITLYPLPEGSDPQAIVAGPDGRMWIPTNSGAPHIIRIGPQMPTGGWPQAAQPRITALNSSSRGIRVSVRCRGIPGLYCGGRLTLSVRAGRRRVKLARTLVTAAAGQGVDLVLRPRGLRSLAGGPVIVASTFDTRDFLGRHGHAVLERRLRVT
ncbi:MAG: hypothetical protein M3Z27_00230 [Actinomycetota bacterium]|nr:hypothetical protein [Actinomycetota bacterium]